jgi:hypothetical protein
MQFVLLKDEPFHFKTFITVSIRFFFIIIISLSDYTQVFLSMETENLLV